MTFRTALVLAPIAFLACRPAPAIVHREAGDDLLSRSKFADAATEYGASLADDPKQPGVWEKLAFCRVKTGELDLAAQTLEKLADLKPTDAQKAEVFRNAAGVYLQSPDRFKAEKYLLAAVKLDPKDEPSLTWLGELASEKGGARLDIATAVPAELDKALGYYAQLIELRPDQKAAYANRRIVLVKYINHLTEERTREQRLTRNAKEPAAVEVRERIARIDAKSAELRRLLDEANAKLSNVKNAAAK